MKKIGLLFVLSILLLIIPFKVDAASATYFGELLDELSSLEQKKADNIYQKQITEEEYAKTSKQIKATTEKITELEKKMVEATKEIERLEEEIQKKEEETKKILVFFQISNGENSYLEYVFKATSFTDFINRLSVVEQLGSYNNKLITEMNELIEQNNKLKEQLEKDRITQEANRKTLQNQLNSLGNRINSMSDLNFSIDEEIDALESLINTYRKNGCSNRTDLIRNCTGIPYDTGFIRPTTIGKITGRYGNRIYPDGSGRADFHSGIDIGVPGNAEGTPIYPIADGYVAGKIKVSQGGQILILHHNIKGKAFTSFYMHLLNYNYVNVGDVVSKNQIIATMGGYSTSAIYFPYSGYDYATFGTHVHLSIATGHILLSNYRAYIVDPDNYIYFPSSFTGRTW